MVKKLNEMSTVKKFAIQYSFEFVVIILGILISLLLQQSRQASIEIERKNNTIKQLVNVIDEDINQIDKFIYLQNYSLKSCNLIFNNLINKNIMQEDSIIYHLSSIGRALRSFFPQEGIFNQLVNTDLIKMIESDELKSRLFKLYNEELKRHNVHTKEYDNFFLSFNYRLSENFLLMDAWSSKPDSESPISIESFDFNKDYYESRKIIADVIESKSSIISYINELKMLSESYQNLKSLCLNELN